MKRLIPLLLPLILCVSTASAKEALELSEVLDSVVRTHPNASMAMAKVGQARGAQISSRGSFDPTITAAATSNPSGYYQHESGQVGLSQRIPGTGASVEGRYRVSRGDIAPYYGERRTRSLGEVSANVVIPLLRDFRTDEARTDIAIAKLDLDRSMDGQRQTELALIRDASNAYFEWVAAGQTLQVARELLEIAQTRADTIAEQAAKGAIPRIEEVDASQIVLARKDRLLKARADFLKTQQYLSLYYRSESMEPVLVAEERIPEAMPSLPLLSQAEMDSLIDVAIAQRPELSQIQREQAAVRATLRLAQNDLLPSLDLQVVVARDMGSGDATLGRTDLGLGLQLKFPIRQRKARGKAMAAQSKLAVLEAEARGLRDRIRAEFQQASEMAFLRDEQATLAQERWRATIRLAEAERIRLAQGASDILRVNLRERDVASAASDAIVASLQRNEVLTQLHFLLMIESGTQGSVPAF